MRIYNNDKLNDKLVAEVGKTSALVRHNSVSAEEKKRFESAMTMSGGLSSKKGFCEEYDQFVGSSFDPASVESGVSSTFDGLLDVFDKRRDEKASKDDCEQEVQLLATACGKPFCLAGIPTAASPSPSVSCDTISGHQAEREADVEKIAQRISEAIYEECTNLGNAPVRFNMKLGAGPELAGMKEISLFMNGDALDITLIRDISTVSGQLMAAAQLLADRLQMKFGRRIVRVLSTEASSDSEAAYGLSDGNKVSLSDLFS